MHWLFILESLSVGQKFSP